MNNCRVNGEITGEIRMTTNKKMKCPQANILIEVPFKHPNIVLRPDYRCMLNIATTGDTAEWINDTCYEGAYIEVRKGFIQTWRCGSGSNKKAFYHIKTIEIDKERSIEKPDDYQPYNIARLAGYFVSQYSKGVMNDGTKRIGFSMRAKPDIAYPGSRYAPYISVSAYADLADKIDGKLEKGQPIDYVEGVMQSYKGSAHSMFNVYVCATRIDF